MTAQPVDARKDAPAISLIDYIDDLDRHGTIDHAVAFELKLRIAKSVPALRSSGTREGAYAIFQEAYVRNGHGENGTRAGIDAILSLPAPAGVREALESIADWCATQRAKIGAIDGYDYHSGEEYGLRCAEIEITKRLSALPQQSAGVRAAAKRLRDMLVADGDPPALNVPSGVDANEFTEAFDALSAALALPQQSGRLDARTVEECAKAVENYYGEDQRTMLEANGAAFAKLFAAAIRALSPSVKEGE